MELACEPRVLQPVYKQVIITIHLQNSAGVLRYDCVGREVQLPEVERRVWGEVQRRGVG